MPSTAKNKKVWGNNSIVSDNDSFMESLELDSSPSGDTLECIRRALTSDGKQQKNNNKDREELNMSLQMCNSTSDGDFEIEQVWQEPESLETDDDKGTVRTHDSNNTQDTFHERIHQRLLVIRQVSIPKVPGSRGKTKDISCNKLQIRLLPAANKEEALDNRPDSTSYPRPLSRPGLLLALETGEAVFYVPPETLVQPDKRDKPAQCLTASEIGLLGRSWRYVLRRLLAATLDPINALRLSRALQLQTAFLTGFEAYLLAEFIRGLDNLSLDKYSFFNRNVCRLILQVIGPRHDFFYHWSTMILHNRLFDGMGQFVSWTRFPATENFPNTRNHALSSIFRIVLGPGNWVTRFLTGGRESLLTDDPDATAQNLAAESNGFELANRNQFGTHFGRQFTQRFRLSHRLPTDESIVRTFVAQPTATLTNNGVFHVIRQVANHWENMLNQEHGNFAHQRMEQLNPFETLRFHLPEVILALTSLRGRNVWDSQVLGPMIRRLQSISPSSSTARVRRLAVVLQLDFVHNICGGIATIVDPMMSWLKSIVVALDRIEDEGQSVYELVSSVELGLRSGYDIMSQTNWTVPSDAILVKAILNYVKGNKKVFESPHIPVKCVAGALERTTPRDKRTLVQLIRADLGGTRPAKLLVARVKTLLQRELRRESLNRAITAASKGEYVTGEMVINEWYWLEETRTCDLFIYRGFQDQGDGHLFEHVNSGQKKVIAQAAGFSVLPRVYIPIAEAITRAQKAFMTIELDHGKVFSYDAFMEFTPLREGLRRLMVVSQMACDSLDNARLNILSEIQRAQILEDTEPQNLIVVGGGPAGMMTCLHCTENVLASGGVVKLFEARDQFAKGGSTYERAQIVRLDARWIAMMRFHLGTGFEDVFIPASGETNSQLGNTLPDQNFVEITIKDLENLLHVEISRYWSRGIISVFTDARSHFDHETRSLIKLGKNLKVGDAVLRRINSEGYVCEEQHSWTVLELVYTQVLDIDEVKVGQNYGVYDNGDQAVLPFKLVSVDLDTKLYHFQSLSDAAEDIHAKANDLPSVYPPRTSMDAHAEVHKVVFQCNQTNRGGRHVRVGLLMETIQNEKFTLDIGKCHVVEAIGKPLNTKAHFCVTTPEPYGVCCLEGLKVSLGMHNFGEKRWGSGIVDDIRSINDQNTRIIGDFTKMVRTSKIVERMSNVVGKDSTWVLHFNNLVTSSTFAELNTVDPVVPKIASACDWLAEHSGSFTRQTLQTRFFEVGDNFYLGMELPREYEKWKRNLVDQLVLSVELQATGKSNPKLQALKDSFAHSVDRLWYYACLETIRTGDVYNPGAKRRVPRLYTIDSLIATNLNSLAVGESFRLVDDMEMKHEILAKRAYGIVVRDVEGYVTRMDESSSVYRESNLTRSPDGNQESKVAISTFPVSHYVSHHTMIESREKGFVFAFAGDEQSTPHFMRYSGLTGAAINAMSFNKFLRDAIGDDKTFVQRFREFADETNWSNGEVVKRGTGANYGEDGFLRPGFSYASCIDYLYVKALECQKCEQDFSRLLTNDWMNKFAAGIIPRGMELNRDFTAALLEQWQDAVYDKLVCLVLKDDRIQNNRIENRLIAAKAGLDPSTSCSEDYWTNFRINLRLDYATKDLLENEYMPVLKQLNTACRKIIDCAAKGYLYGDRISSEFSNQPKPVDSVVDDFAVEAQNFANSLTMAAAFGAGALALRLFDQNIAEIFSAVLGALNILISFGTMTNVARYKIRNEEARLSFKDEKFQYLKLSAFTLMDPESQSNCPPKTNPILVSIEREGKKFRKMATYYGYDEPTGFREAFGSMKDGMPTVAELKAFQRYIARDLIANKYHVNSYLQEALVAVYRTADEALRLLRHPCNDARTNRKAKHLFKHLLLFEERLERTLQRGPVRWGFLKVRKLSHSDVAIVIRYIYSILWWPISLFVGGCGYITPIEQETRSLLRQVQDLSECRDPQHGLNREVFDTETLYWATRESDIASLISVVATLTFLVSILFTIARVALIARLTDIAFFAAGISGLGAILAVFHLVRKFFILVNLWSILGEKRHEIPDHALRRLRLIRGVTSTQIFLTFTRLLAAAAAAVALPFSVAETGYSDKIPTIPNLPFYVAGGSIALAILAVTFFFFVEYVVRYRLSPQLGPFVCDLFHQEIQDLHKIFASTRSNYIDTKQKQQRTAWEYTARAFLHKYRFDTVFAADRFGNILQQIQSAQMKEPDAEPSIHKPEEA